MTSKGRLLRASVGLAGIALGAKALGFVRDVVLAAQFGATRETDAFFLVFTVWFQFGLLLLLAMSKVLVPRWTFVEHDDDAAGRLVGSVLAAVAIVLGAGTAAVALFGETFVALIAPEFDAPTRALTGRLLVIALPSVVLCGVAGLYLAIARARGRLWFGDVGLLAVNGGVVAGLLVGAERWGIEAAAWGMSCGVAVTSLLLLGYGISTHVPVRLRLDREGFGVLLASIGVLTFGAAGGHALTLVNRVFFGLLPEGVLTCFGYAERALTLPLTIGMYALLTALLPQLASAVRDGDRPRARRLALGTLRTLLFWITPMVVLLGVLAEPAIGALFGRGAFDDDAVRITAALVVLLIPAALLGVARSVVAELFYAEADVRTPVIAAAVGVCVCLATFPFVWRPFGVGGLVAARVGADAVAFAWLGVAARRSLGVQWGALVPFVFRIALASLVAAALGRVVLLGSGVPLPAAVGLAGFAFLGTYFGVARTLGLRDAGALLQMRKTPRSQPA